MGWNDLWGPGRWRREPYWWEVTLWVVIAGVFNIGIISAVWSNRVASMVLIAVSVFGWVWVFRGGRSRGAASSRVTESRDAGG